MNVLEKILEEIEEKFKTADAEKFYCEELCDAEDWYDSGYINGQVSAYKKCKDIIRSHIDEAKDTNIHSNDDDYIMFTLNKDGVAEIYRDTYDTIIHCESIEEQKRVREILERCNDWIPVEERLPNQNGVYNVTRLVNDIFISDSAYFDGQDTWHNDNRVNHTRPYLIDIVTWKPLPEPYKPKKTIPAAGMDHIMNRFTKVE